MPPLPAVPGVVEVKLVYTEAEDINTINRFFLHYGGLGPTAAQLASFANTTVSNSWGASLGGQTNTNTSLTRVQVTDLSGPSAAQGEWDGAVAGTKAGAALSASACAVIQLKIARRYRGGHPRQYLPGRTVTDLTDSQRWSPAFIAAMKTAYDAFITFVVASPWASGGPLTQVNVSRYEGFTNYTTSSGRNKSRAVPRLIPLEDLVIATAVNPKVGSQRRRNLQSS